MNAGAHTQLTCQLLSLLKNKTTYYTAKPVNNDHLHNTIH